MYMDKYVIIAVYFHPKRDADLIQLSAQVGKKTFAKICKYAVEALAIPELANNARELCKKKLDVYEEPVDSIRISLNAAQDETIRKLIDHLKPRTKCTFIKQVIRYNLGASVILPLFLDDEFREQIAAPVTYTAQFVIAGESTTYKRKRRKATRKPTVKTEEIPRIKKTPTISEKSEDINENIYTNNIFNTTNEPEDNNTEDTSPGTDADDILALLNNMIG